ncbi:MAG: MerR family transcriptional regulator [Bauldia sp.]
MTTGNGDTAAATATRLGLTVRALRVFEQRGLLRPPRSAAGWRVYGDAEIARLHQIVALKRLGLKLSQIAALLNGRRIDLDRLLEAQASALEQQRDRIDSALAAIRRARRRIGRSEPPGIEELVAIIRETNMSEFKPSPELSALVAKHTDPGRVKALHPGWTAADQARVGAQWTALIGEAEALLGSDPAAPAALDLARRWQALAGQFTRGDPALTQSVQAVYREGFAKPEMAQHMPFSAEVYAFVGKAMAALNAHGDGPTR